MAVWGNAPASSTLLCLTNCIPGKKAGYCLFSHTCPGVLNPVCLCLSHAAVQQSWKSADSRFPQSAGIQRTQPSRNPVSLALAQGAPASSTDAALQLFGCFLFTAQATAEAHAGTD